MPNFWESATQTLPGAYQDAANAWRRQQLLNQQLAEQKRQERIAAAKERAAARLQRMKEAQKRHQEFIEKNKEAVESFRDMSYKFKIANKRLKPYLDKGKIGDADYETVMQAMQDNPSMAMKYLDSYIKEIDDREERKKQGSQSFESIFNRAMEKYTSGGFSTMTPYEVRIVELYGGRGLLEPGQFTPTQPRAGTISESMLDIRKVGEIKQAQKKYQETMSKAGESGRDEMNIAKAEYEKWLDHFQNSKSPNYMDALEELANTYSTKEAAQKGPMSFYEWLSSKKSKTYPRAFKLFNEMRSSEKLFMGRPEGAAQYTIPKEEAIQEEATQEELDYLKQLEDIAKRLGG